MSNPVTRDTGTCVERRVISPGTSTLLNKKGPNFWSEAVRRYSVEEVRWCTGSPRSSISRRRISCATCPLITIVPGSMGSYIVVVELAAADLDADGFVRDVSDL